MVCTAEKTQAPSSCRGNPSAEVKLWDAYLISSSDFRDSGLAGQQLDTAGSAAASPPLAEPSGLLC